MLDPVLEPAAQRLVEETDPHPHVYEVPLEQARARLRQLQAGDGVPKPEIDEEWVEVDAGAWGMVRARIVRPQGAAGMLPVFLYLHGGGWVVGDSDTHDRLVRELVVGSGAAAVFPLYDRAPEAKYPTQIEQSYAVVRWAVREGARHGLDAARLAVCGDSSGGGMAAALALMAKERGDVHIKAQMLLYPTLDANFETSSYQQFADHYYNTRAAMQWFWDQYTADPAQRTEPHASPLRATLEDLRGMPPTLLITGEADVLRDEGEAYAAKLREAEADVTALRILGTVHDFLLLDSLRDTNAAKLGRLLVIEALKAT
ncbi:alpha/beta hydrolase fold protein-3 domain protein [Catenulispora acidiphila DSM 44928]|uniref:Alpha/beta hydrolase fold protein-3 domain protein n=1 Tax=Catenulispora acidiphila (strain DSM 44928 / JCM 14897 / NBRC 102108 / NRRL B-24433 / ID139908) TaxID=479433 RepID=C7Q4X2_CATAD|nr:alpha/beta hydrolase [Catenulispora acidiphila]ACU73920.1 alpha/beta hydrolase fold protein-3 domain protein [Catenulispora acidiphila DSM 44928]